MALGSLIAIGNILGCVAAIRRQRKGIDKGYSSVPFLSVIFCGLAYATGKDSLGRIVLLPCLFDPGTLMTLYFPWVIWTEFIKPKVKR